jgi:glycerophosphoryl diester phosphodiesterase
LYYEKILTLILDHYFAPKALMLARPRFCLFSPKPFMMPFVIVLLVCLLTACQGPSGGSSLPLPAGFDLQGHRGCRGLMPENSIPGFCRALDLGVTTLEMDLVITADSLVLVSHEPWLSEEICAQRDGTRIPADRHARYNLFAMTYEEIQAYDCGSLPHPRFPTQAKHAVHKPLLRAVIDSADAHARATGRSLPRYNLEIKRRPEGDGVYHPAVEPFVRLVLAELTDQALADRCVIQSFDPEALRVTRRLAPNVPLALLIENQASPQVNLDQLGFVPAIYSPDHGLVDADLISFAHEREMQVIPWTVNESSDLAAMLALGVDGLITDYPDRLRPAEPRP